MIKVIHLITGLGLGGAEKQLTQVVSFSDPTRFKHVVISLQDQAVFGAELVSRGISVYTLNMSPSRFSLISLYRLIKIFKTEKPDILQTWLYHADLLGLCLGKLCKIPKIVWNIRCSNMENKKYSWLTAVVLKCCVWLSGMPTKVIVNSRSGQASHEQKGYRPKAWTFIPNGFQVDHFKPNPSIRSAFCRELGFAESNLVLGMVARFDPMKDHLCLLKAVQLLSQNFPDLQLVLVGSGLEKTNAALWCEVERLGLQSQVHLLGPRKDVVEVLQALDVFVLSSAFGEGFPNVLGEAMACGVPCVATEVGDSAVIIGETGRISAPSNPEALANALSSVLALTREEREMLGAKARARIQEHYSVEKMLSRYESFYESIYQAPESVEIIKVGKI